MADLKPCPFCGREAYQRTDYPCDEDGLEMNLFAVGCMHCEIEFSCLWNKDAVIEAWNTRKPMEAIQKQIHNAGGCDGTTDYDKGWDDAIREAERIVKEETKG